MLEATLTIIIAILGFEDGRALLDSDGHGWLQPGDSATVYRVIDTADGEQWTRLGDGIVAQTDAGLALLGLDHLADHDPATLKARFATAARPRAAREPASDGLGARVHAWAAAWAAQHVDTYLSLYAPNFEPATGETRDAWAANRRLRIAHPRSITVSLDALELRITGPDRAHASFVQHYRSDTYSDTVHKQLELIWDRDDWYILREDVTAP